MASRVCSCCNKSLAKSSYSTNQWSKKKDSDGNRRSKCKNCVAGLHSTKHDVIGGADKKLSAVITTGMAQVTLEEKVEKQSELMCGACGKTDNGLKLCTGCKCVRYCNRDCQVAHRQDHKDACKFIVEMREENGGEDPIVCHDCLRVFTTETQLKYHRELKISCVVETDDDDSSVEREMLEDQEDDLLNTLLEIEICEIKLSDVDNGEDIMEHLNLQRGHWFLCYRRESILEELRMEKVTAEWTDKEAIRAEHIDNDNVQCVLCTANMPFDGEDVSAGHEFHTGFDNVPNTPQFFRAKRLYRSGARYCPNHTKHDFALDCKEVPVDLQDASDAEIDTCREHLLRHAKDGQSWAQLEIAEHPEFMQTCEDNTDHYYHENEAIKWACKAADAGNIHAIIFLSKICHSGRITTASNEHGAYSWKPFYDIPEREKLMKRAADTGDFKALLHYAEYAGKWIEPRSEAIKYWTITAYCAEDREQAIAYRRLAEELERDEASVPPERILYLYEQASMPRNRGENGDPVAQARFAYCLNNQSTARFGSDDLPRFSELPKMMFWAKLSAGAGCREGIDLLKELQDRGKGTCACSHYEKCCLLSDKKRKSKTKNEQRQPDLFPCNRCGAVFFCSDKCRVLFDTIGHVEDCCDCADCVKGGGKMGLFDWCEKGSRSGF